MNSVGHTMLGDWHLAAYAVINAMRCSPARFEPMRRGETETRAVKIAI
jgi:hypothetical protein